MRPIRTLGVFLGGFVLLAMLYVGSYALLVSNDVHPMAIPERTVVVDPDRFYFRRIRPEYCFGGELAETIFAPVHEVDLAWRYDHWHFTFNIPPLTTKLSTKR
jgi:hypothetical protein